MGKTYRRESFRKELQEAMAISPSRRAREEREMLEALHDWFREEAPQEFLPHPLHKEVQEPVILSEIGAA